MSILEQRIEQTFEGVKYSVSVEAVVWKCWELGERSEGRPTPWEVPTEKVAELFAKILCTVLEPYDIPKVSELMTDAWIEQFWPSEG